MSDREIESTAVVQDAQPFSEAETTRIIEDFQRDGFRPIPGVLTPDEVEAMKAGIDRVLANPRSAETDNMRVQNGAVHIALRLFEADPVFEDMLTREPIISLVESILGEDCHLIAQSAIRNPPGEAIDTFHVDDPVIFPLPEGVARHDPKIPMPVLVMTVQIALTDIPSIEYGPTQYVPGSHYSGRAPNDLYNPNFEGREPVSIFCKAGDIYLHNGQCWHRGAPNASNQVRYLSQMACGKRFISQRFYPFMNYQLPPHVIERADERRRRVLGLHPKGAYG